MSWVRIWIHLVFSTKNREPFLGDSIRETVIEHIKMNAVEKEIWLDSINGYVDHIHCLISINKEQTLSNIVRLIKGESSFWINKNKLTNNKFVWQDDYWAVSVSESHLNPIRNYIKSQEEHHRVKTFLEEVKEFMQKYGWNYEKEKCG
jgi:putative transposase